MHAGKRVRVLLAEVTPLSVSITARLTARFATGLATRFVAVTAITAVTAVTAVTTVTTVTAATAATAATATVTATVTAAVAAAIAAAVATAVTTAVATAVTAAVTAAVATAVTAAVATAVTTAVATAVATAVTAAVAAAVTWFRVRSRRRIRLFTSTACVITLACPAWQNTNLGHAGRLNHRTRDFNDTATFASVTDWRFVWVLRTD